MHSMIINSSIFFIILSPPFRSDILPLLELIVSYIDANIHMLIYHYGKHIKGKALEVDDTVKMYDLERIGDTFGGTIEKQS